MYTFIGLWLIYTDFSHFYLFFSNFKPFYSQRFLRMKLLINKKKVKYEAGYKNSVNNFRDYSLNPSNGICSKYNF